MTDSTTTPTKPKKKSLSSRAKKRKPGRSNPNLLPFEEARAYIQTEMIESVGGFEKWWQRNQPKSIPRFPYRVYEKKGWVSWNDFLGSSNVFVGKKIAKWRHFEEAVVWAHTLKLETQAQWGEFAKSDKKPVDIPQRPDLVYSKWVSWNYWLGNKPSERVQVAEENHGIFYVIHEHGVPGNVLTFGVELGGLHAMKQRWDRSNYDIVKFFKNSRSKTERITEIINSLTSEYMGSSKQRIAQNVWEVIWYIQMELEIITNLSVTGPASQPSNSNGLMPMQ